MMDHDQTSVSGICVVSAGGPYCWILVNALRDHFGAISVVLEKPEVMTAFLARRAKKQGWISVAGQALTMALGKLGKRLIAPRLARIVHDENLQPEAHPGQRITNVDSINSEAFLTAVDALKPKVILLVGSRLMKGAILARLPCKVLNYHAGITPQYRGMNGGYWARATGDTAHYGATVHSVDQGVDTGAVIAQVRGVPSPEDTIMTDAHRLAAMSRGICIAAVGDALTDTLKPLESHGPSHQWYHPPIWQYLWTGLTRKVW